MTCTELMSHPKVCVVHKTPCCGEQVEFHHLDWSDGEATKRCACGSILLFGPVDYSCRVKATTTTKPTSQKEHP